MLFTSFLSHRIVFVPFLLLLWDKQNQMTDDRLASVIYRRSVQH